MDLSQEALELVTWLEHTEDLYKHKTAIFKNYARKMAKGAFDKDLAIKGLLPLTITAAKSYADEFADEGKWNTIFSVDDRREVAQELVDQFVEEYEFDQENAKSSEEAPVEEEMGVMEAVDDEDVETEDESDEEEEEEDDLDDDDVYGYLMKNRGRDAKVANRPAKTPKPTLGEDNEGGEKYITITFENVTEDSAEQGEAETIGWADERGGRYEDYDDSLKISMMPDEYDVEDGLTPVDLAIKTLKDAGARHPNDSHLPSSYGTEGDIDFVSGDVETLDYHLNGFTSEELMEIKQGLMIR